MRLINTDTLELEQFFGATPRYAILSHTWEDEEVSLHEMTDRPPSLAAKKGYRKIVDYCRLAAQQGYAWVWVDTCCINKTSDAELSESINSMFRWYEEAAVCHVFLSDLPVDADLQQTLPCCRWFTRGWTLQELIAPRRVEFYDRGWVVRGTREALVGELSAITKIDSSALRGAYRDFRIGVRMSWAANRETTRPEDTAYCLLGLLDISMPMLYGEGQRAFRRLQEEIIRKSNDLSIFAWGEDAAEVTGYSPLLAPSPRQFPIPLESQKLLPTGLQLRQWQLKYAVTNNGLQIRTRLGEDAAKVTGCSALLAPSPRQFAIHHESRELLPTGLPPRDWQPQYTVTNNGLQIRTRLQLLFDVPEPGTNKEPSTDDGEGDGRESGPRYFFPLAEEYSTEGVGRHYRDKIPGIILDKVGPNFFQRRRGPLHVVTSSSDVRETESMEFYIKLDDETVWDLDNVYSVCEGSVNVYRTRPSPTLGDAKIRVERAIPESLWDHTRRVFLRPSSYQHVCAFSFSLTLDGKVIPLLCVFRASWGFRGEALLSDPAKSREVYQWFCRTKSATEDTFWNDLVYLEVGWRCLHLRLAGIRYSVRAYVTRHPRYGHDDIVEEYVIGFTISSQSETGCKGEGCNMVKVEL